MGTHRQDARGRGERGVGLDAAALLEMLPAEQKAALERGGHSAAAFRLGSRLAERRRFMGLTLAGLAEKSGVPIEVIDGIEAGRIAVQADRARVEKLFACLDANPPETEMYARFGVSANEAADFVRHQVAG